MVQGPQPRRQTPACAKRNFTKLSCPHLSRFRKTQSGEVSGQGQHRRYKSRLGGVGMGLTMGWESASVRARAGTQGWREGSGLYRLAFLEGALRLEPFPKASL